MNRHALHYLDLHPRTFPADDLGGCSVRTGCPVPDNRFSLFPVTRNRKD